MLLCNLKLLLSLLPLPKTAKQAWELQLPQTRTAKATSSLPRHEALLQMQKWDVTQDIPHQQLPVYSQKQVSWNSAEPVLIILTPTQSSHSIQGSHQSHANQPCTPQGLACLSESRQCLSLLILLWLGSLVPSPLQFLSIISLDKNHYKYLPNACWKSLVSL